MTKYKAFRFRLYPTKTQDLVMRETLERLRELYNAALQERIGAYKNQGISLSLYEQMRELPDVKAVRPEYADIYAQVLRGPLVQIDEAYKNFFHRLKNGTKRPGFPKFKKKGQYKTFVYPQASTHGVKISDKEDRVRLAGIGDVKIKIHRPIEGNIKQALVTVESDEKWHITFISDGIKANILPKTGVDVGIDIGINVLAALSDGQLVSNPKAYDAARESIARAHRRVARRNKGSARRRAAVILLSKTYSKIRRIQLDFQHKMSLSIVREFDTIFIEDLNVSALAQGWLGKCVNRAAWGQFRELLANKAENAGRELIAVDPRGTSQECSKCEEPVHKILKVRTHICPHCGLILDRDINAARNILRRGQRLRGGVASGLA